MGLTKLGKYILPFDERNEESLYGENSVVGLSTQKEMIKTKANLSGVNLKTYKLFPPLSFAYVPDTSRRGEKISLAFNNTKETFLVSSIYIVFTVSNLKEFDSWFLFMYFNRPEFDSYSRFNSWGSARETFNWEDMCDTDIELPPLSVQQKYVDIYKAMVANQQSYERGLEDLKLVVDSFLDKIKKSSPKKEVRDVLKEVDFRNDSGEFREVQGINITKNFMPSVANVTGVDLKNYKVVKKGQFAYSGMQTGRDECIRIAFHKDEMPIIISPAYTVFEVKHNSILPEFIMMWFSRSESDRRGWFMSDSSIRSNLDLNRFYETEIPVPDYRIQKSIADIYSVYLKRKRINEQLKAQIKDICPILIKGSLEEGI